MSPAKINRRQLHHYYRQVRFIRPWYFLLTAVIFFGLAIYGLRHNNLTMVSLREKVIKADENNKDVETPLANLRNYVYSHMNTNLSGGKFAISPPIQLKNRYERLVSSQEKTIQQANERVKERGEAICAVKHPESGYNAPRVACVQKYVQTHATQTGDIPEDLYKFDFVSPKWTPDFAGLTLVAGFFFSALFICWLVLERWVRTRMN